MHSEGHAGLTLIIFSLLLLPFGYSEKAVLLIVMAAGLSFLPDLDLNLGIKHRTWTHNIGFGLASGILFGALFYQETFAWGVIGFLGGFGGTLSHLLGDMFTHQRFEPLQPLSDHKTAFGLFRSDSVWNKIFLLAGGFCLFLYIRAGTGESGGVIQTLREVYDSLTSAFA